jgi:hypothetical protein
MLVVLKENVISMIQYVQSVSYEKLSGIQMGEERHYWNRWKASYILHFNSSMCSIYIMHDKKDPA